MHYSIWKCVPKQTILLKKKRESTEMIKTSHPGIKEEHISCLLADDDDILTENRDFTPLCSHIFIPCTLVSEKKKKEKKKSLLF